MDVGAQQSDGVSIQTLVGFEVLPSTEPVQIELISVERGPCPGPFVTGRGQFDLSES